MGQSSWVEGGGRAGCRAGKGSLCLPCREQMATGARPAVMELEVQEGWCGTAWEESWRTHQTLCEERGNQNRGLPGVVAELQELGHRVQQWAFQNLASTWAAGSGSWVSRTHKAMASHFYSTPERRVPGRAVSSGGQAGVEQGSVQLDRDVLWGGLGAGQEDYPERWARSTGSGPWNRGLG